MQLPDISFRARILVALVGTVGLLGAASMAVVRIQTNRQVDEMVQRTAVRSQQAMTELERFRRADLERIARRFTGSIRIPAALEAALEGGGAEEFVQHVQYELTLAELEQGLVAFTDDEGTPVVTLVDGVRVTDTASPFARQVIDSDMGPASGYRVFDGRLFAVQGHLLELFGEPVGTLTLGFPVDDEVASRLGEVAGVEVCFAVAALDRCLAGTEAARRPGPSGEMQTARHATGPVFTGWNGRRVALVSTPLSGAGDIQTVIAVPLDDVLTPFDRIERAERVAAGLVLLLAVVLGVLLSKGLTAPIRTLVAATERVRRGDYEFEVAVPNRDEIGRLADAFNQMIRGLLLKERYRGVLDKVVSHHIAEELLRGEIRLGGETREVTTLFADVRGFTALTERMAPHDVIGLLNEWLELAAGSIEREGGAVDKYVGDQVMAIFGAPLAQADHAVRAVRAALRLRDLTDEMNRNRVARGAPPFEIGIGINTGPAVAGNTGSSRRLNYTVLGASVNAAARLCSEAGPAQVLVSETTHARLGGAFDATPLPPRVLKGFSRPVTPYDVRQFRGESPSPPGPVQASAVAALLLSAGLLVAAPAPVCAQVFDLPTLEAAGVRYVSPGGLVQIQPRVRLDLEGFFPQDEPAWHIDEVEPFVNIRGRFFADAFAGRRLFASTEIRIDRGQPPRAGGLDLHVQQGFVRVTPRPGTNVHVQAGKFISPFGNYPQRAHSQADPFIRPPLPYDHRTVMQPDFAPLANDGVLGWKDNPALRPDGLPIVWAVPYPIGAMLMGGRGALAYRAGVVNTPPSADPADWNRLRFGGSAGPSVIGHVSCQIVPELQVGASYNRGSYVRGRVEDQFGPIEVDRQQQETIGVEATIRRGHLDVRGELLFNRWEVPRVIDDPRDVSYYLEARLTLAPGLFAAARYGAIHFGEIARSAGDSGRWDYDVRRWQLGTGYRLGRSTEVRAEYMINRATARADPRDNLLSLQWWWAF